MDNFLFFYSHVKKASDIYNKHVFSQWFPCVFVDKDENVYSCAEQYMMAQKALLFKTDKRNNKIFSKIMATNDPKKIKALGRKVYSFNENIWNNKKFEIVCAGNMLKFS